MFLEENRNAAIEKFISKERMKEKIAKEKLDIAQERIAYLENLNRLKHLGKNLKETILTHGE